jgi:hypothetical protein
MKDYVVVSNETETTQATFPGADIMLNEALAEGAAEAVAIQDNAKRLEGYISVARSAYRQSKTSAAEAAVLCYLVYRGTLSDAGKSWLADQVKAANAAINQHNANEKALQDRVTKYLKALAVSPKEAATWADAADLQELVELTEADWNRRLKVEIGARKGTAEWTQVVKLALELNSSFNASVVSRFVTVVGYLVRQFPDAVDADYSKMVAKILKKGGFDSTYAAQLHHDRHGDDDEAADGSDDGTVAQSDEEILEKYKATQIAAGLLAMPSLANITMPVQKAADGYTLLLGRVVDGSVEVIGEADVGEKRLADVVAKHGGKSAGQPYAGSEFLWNLLSLGDLVAEGQATKLPRNGLQGDDTLKVERRLVLKNTDMDGNFEVMISARNADASIIVKGKPNEAVVKLGPPVGLLGLTARSYEAVYDLLSDPINRSLWDVSALHNPTRADGMAAKNSPAWVAHCSVLQAKGSKNHTKTFYLNDITKAHNLPLDVDGFRPEVLQDLKKTDLVAMYRDRKNGWDVIKKADKTGQIMSLEFKNSQLKLKALGQDDYTVTTNGNGSFLMSLPFRAQDLMAVLGKLCEANTEVFTLSADKAGLLVIQWADSAGTYQICLPTANAEGRMQSRRLAPISLADTIFVPQAPATK